MNHGLDEPSNRCPKKLSKRRPSKEDFGLPDITLTEILGLSCTGLDVQGFNHELNGGFSAQFS